MYKLANISAFENLAANSVAVTNRGPRAVWEFDPQKKEKVEDKNNPNMLFLSKLKGYQAPPVMRSDQSLDPGGLPPVTFYSLKGSANSIGELLAGFYAAGQKALDIIANDKFQKAFTSKFNVATDETVRFIRFLRHRDVQRDIGIKGSQLKQAKKDILDYIDEFQNVAIQRITEPFQRAKAQINDVFHETPGGYRLLDPRRIITGLDNRLERRSLERLQKEGKLTGSVDELLREYIVTKARRREAARWVAGKGPAASADDRKLYGTSKKDFWSYTYPEYGEKKQPPKEDKKQPPKEDKKPSNPPNPADPNDKATYTKDWAIKKVNEWTNNDPGKLNKAWPTIKKMYEGEKAANKGGPNRATERTYQIYSAVKQALNK